MSLSVLLEVAIGMLTVWMLLAIVCSGLGEWWATQRRLRARFLRRGLVNLLPDQWAYLRLLFHPTLRGAFGDEPGKRAYPSYLPPREVARALVDVVLDKAKVARGGDPDQRAGVVTPQQVVEALSLLKSRGDPLAPMLLPLVQRIDGASAPDAANALDDLYGRIETWYTSSMDRVSGWYKRHAQRNLFVIGTLIAVVCNVDSIALVHHFAANPKAREVVTVAAQRYLDAHKEAEPEATAEAAEARFKEAVTGLAGLQDAGLPIGFGCLAGALLDADADYFASARECGVQIRKTAGGPGLPLKVIGWLITGLMVSFGAPFWFDLLKRLMEVRGTGPKPAPRQG